ncbi:unnamed protein product [Rhizophagus irregularis]|nr:unnamed protein product [Rhizophagus irregularis]
MSLSLDDATTSNDPMNIGSSFVNEEISIDPQESTSSSENLSTFSSKRRKRSRYNTYLERDTQMQNINDSDDNNNSNEETDNYGDSDDGDDSDDNDDGMMGMITMMGMIAIMGMMGIIMKLGLKHQFVKFSVCPSCHKLHNIDDVKQHTIQQHKAIKKCGHVQFPNHRSLRQCNAPLSEQKELDDGKVINAPLLIYLMPSIKEQLLQMYQRPNFEKNLKL